MSRDEIRRIQCEKVGITLIEIPYWWDEKECKKLQVFNCIVVSLLATILQARPDLMKYIQSDYLNGSSIFFSSRTRYGNGRTSSS